MAALTLFDIDNKKMKWHEKWFEDLGAKWLIGLKVHKDGVRDHEDMPISHTMIIYKCFQQSLSLSICIYI